MSVKSASILKDLLKFYVKFRYFPLLTLKSQSPNRIYFLAVTRSKALPILIAVLVRLVGVCVKNTNELIVPLASNVCDSLADNNIELGGLIGLESVMLVSYILACAAPLRFCSVANMNASVMMRMIVSPDLLTFIMIPQFIFTGDQLYSI
jgi:hypothetical protein